MPEPVIWAMGVYAGLWVLLVVVCPALDRSAWRVPPRDPEHELAEFEDRVEFGRRQQ